MTDTTFATNGCAYYDEYFNQAEEPKKILGMSDGSIIIAGVRDDASAYNNDQLYFAKYTHDGMLDSTFGTNGFLLVNICTGADRLYRLRENSVGNVVVGAGYPSIGGEPGYCDVFTILPSGQIDLSFGDAGFSRVTDPASSTTTMLDICILPDDKIIVLGSDSYGYGPYFTYKLLSTGHVDTTYRDGGSLSVIASPSGEMWSLGYAYIEAFESNMVYCYSTVFSGIHHEGVLFRLDSTGRIDSSFAENGFFWDGGSDSLDTQNLGLLLNENRIYTSSISVLNDTIGTGHIKALNFNGGIDSSFAENGTSDYPYPYYGPNTLPRFMIDTGVVIFASQPETGLGFTLYDENNELNADFGDQGSALNWNLNCGGQDAVRGRLFLYQSPGKMVRCGGWINPDWPGYTWNIALTRVLLNSPDIETGQVEPTSEYVLRAYPNPCGPGDIVHLFETSGICRVELIDALGAATRATLNPSGDVLMPDAIGTGIYLLRVFDKKGTHIARLIVQGDF